MSEPDPVAAGRRLEPHELRPAVRRPWWRRVLPSLVVTAPAIALAVIEVVDMFRAPEPQQLSSWLGIALCAAWLHMLLRVIVPLARRAWWLDGVFAALSAIALLQGLDVGVGWIVAGACAAAAAMLALQRPRARPLPAAPVARAHPTVTSSIVAFSESSANAARAVLIALGCLAAVGLGIMMVVTNGPIGWWYFLAALVWLTGSIPWMMRVTLDRTGLAVRSLLLPGSLARIPLAEIAEVEAGLAYAKHWGQGNAIEQGTTSILRGDGAALLVTRTDGSQVIVSVDRPDEAVETFAALRAGGSAS